MNRLREEAMESMGEETEDDFEPEAAPKIEL